MGDTPAVREQHVYRHFGLTLGANERLAGVTQVSPPVPDVNIEFLEPGQVAASERPWTVAGPSIWRAQVGEDRWLRVRYAFDDTWAEFVFDGHGESVWVSRSPDVLLSEATELLLGPMFSCLAAQRGLTCIHGSVVHVEDRTLVLIGPSGAGKSTTALALVQSAGGTLVSDDVAILSEHDERITVAAGAQRIRMREAPAMALLGKSRYEALDPVWEDGRPVEPKRYLAMQDSKAIIDERPLPLDIIYFLVPWSDTVAEPSVRALTPASALPRLMAERHMVQAIDGGSHKRDFDRLANLLRAAPVRELVRPAGLETTEQTVATIVSDVRGLN